MGNAYDEKLEHDKAIKCYNRAIEIDPNYIKPWNNMGVAYINKKEYDKAIECYKKALEIDPNDIGALRNIGYMSIILERSMINLLNTTKRHWK